MALSLRVGDRTSEAKSRPETAKHPLATLNAQKWGGPNFPSSADVERSRSNVRGLGPYGNTPPRTLFEGWPPRGRESGARAARQVLHVRRRLNLTRT